MIVFSAETTGVDENRLRDKSCSIINSEAASVFDICQKGLYLFCHNANELNMTVNNRNTDQQSPAIPEPDTLGLASSEPLELSQCSLIENSSLCFHCHLPIPDGFRLTACIESQQQPMCCYGCKAVADAIVAAGHEHFYRVRTEPSSTAAALVPEFLRETQIYDSESVQREFVRQLSESEREASLILEGITCAACVWLNERHISGLPGVLEVQVNYSSHRAWLRWDSSCIKLSEILQAIQAIGYRALPYNPEQQQAFNDRERRTQVRRLAVAGLFGMQVMMVSISLYSGAWSGMEENFETLFRWLSLGLTLPVLFYSATTFFRSAWIDLKHQRMGMDVPVSLGIGIAFVSSTIATILGQGEIYFDSVVMFVFLLLISRYFEWMARQRSSESVERLAHALPMMANRLDDEGNDSLVAASLLNIGDIVLIRPGETIPADGEVLVGISCVDESLLSGESHPVDKTIGDMLVGGSINVNSPLQIRVQSVGSDTVLASIHRMIERAQSDKPSIARLADRIASKFVVGVIGVAILVSCYWWFAGSEDWLNITLAVLIVTCPCALSLATPAAISAGLSRMQNIGLLIKRGQAIDALSRVTHVVFDKTGTLTYGKPVLNKILCDGDVDPDFCLRIAASLEKHSEHPVAQALINAASGQNQLLVKDLINQSGGGLSGYVDDQHYALGSIDFIQTFNTCPIPENWLLQINNEAATAVILANETRNLCVFTLHDEVRADAAELISELKRQKKKTLLMTGDQTAVAQRVANLTGIDECYANLKPDEKMACVQGLQSTGASVLMVGDGINDAPVLSSANVSIAMGGATSLAKTNADIVMLGNRLNSIIDALSVSTKTDSSGKQKFVWAIGYNICAMPAAGTGYVSPWMAAIGMSLSSLIVVINALRLASGRTNSG